MRFDQVLARRVRDDGARPLVTCYDADGMRTELSAITFANWVAKTVNLLQDTLGTDLGEPVAVRLASQHPAHWMTLVWYAAVWQSGAVVDVDPDSRARVEVIGPGDPLAASADDHLLCSLHPLGLAAASVPEGAIDWAAEVKAEPDDVVTIADPSPSDPAWTGAGRTATFADLLSVDRQTDRVMIITDDPWTAATSGLLGPLLGGGSAVTVPVGSAPELVERIGAAEKTRSSA